MFYHVRLDNMKRARMQKAKAKTGTEEEGNGEKKVFLPENICLLMNDAD